MSLIARLRAWAKPVPKLPRATMPVRPSYYIPTSDSPWAVIVHLRGKWEVTMAMHQTREEARNWVTQWESACPGKRARVVRLIVPTR